MKRGIMETLKRFGRFCGTICSVVITFIISAATLAVTNAFSPTELKDKITSTTNGLVDVATNQMVVNGVPENYAGMIKANLGVDQLVAMLNMTLIGVLMGLLWLIGGTIWARIFPASRWGLSGLSVARFAP